MFNPNEHEWLAVTFQLWIVFLVIFFVLGYPPLFCIFLGLIGGMAGGLVVAYVKGVDQAPPETTTQRQSPLKQAQERIMRQISRDRRGSEQGGAKKRSSGRKRRRSLSSKR
jgi:uncharacterized membrane protein